MGEYLSQKNKLPDECTVTIGGVSSKFKFSEMHKNTVTESSFLNSPWANLALYTSPDAVTRNIPPGGTYFNPYYDPTKPEAFILLGRHIEDGIPSPVITDWFAFRQEHTFAFSSTTDYEWFLGWAINSDVTGIHSFSFENFKKYPGLVSEPARSFISAHFRK